MILIKANMTQEMSLDTMVRNIHLNEMLQKNPNQVGHFNFHGAFRQTFIDLVAMRIPLPAIYVIEDRDGNYHAAGEYANDFLTSLSIYITANEDERHLVRRAMETTVEVIIIRCNNSNEKIKNLLEILKSLKVTA